MTKHHPQPEPTLLPSPLSPSPCISCIVWSLHLPSLAHWYSTCFWTWLQMLLHPQNSLSPPWSVTRNLYLFRSSLLIPLWNHFLTTIMQNHAVSVFLYYSPNLGNLFLQGNLSFKYRQCALYTCRYLQTEWIIKIFLFP